MKTLLRFILMFGVALLCATASRAAESACFVATAYNEYGESPRSIEVCSTPIPVGGSVILTWNKVNGATGYKIYYRPAWEASHSEARSLDVGDVDMARVVASDIFKLSTPPVLIIQAEE